MREIKFRGKRLDNGKWIEGDLIRINGHTFIFPDPAPKGIDKYTVDPETVGYYTGLKDRTGKDVWVGDIFKEDRTGIVRSVFCVPGGFAFEDNPVVFGYDHRTLAYPYSSIAGMEDASWLSQCCEIIGNIHDNPELLKQD